MTRKRILLSAALAFCLLLAIFLFRSGGSENMVYLTEEAATGSVSRVVSATGEVGAVQLVTVGARVSGQIMKLYVEVGQQVKKGDLIAELDSVPQINQLQTDQAQLQAYQAQLAAKKISLRMAESQYLRAQKLRTRDAASQESLENLQDAYALAKADVAVMESQIRQTQLAVSTDEENLGYTRITAPLDGVVVSVPVDEGQTVNAAQTTPTIAQIADLKRMELKVEISEGDITAVKAGLPISYTILAEPDDVRQAVLTSIDPGLTTLTDGSYKTTSTTSSSSTSTAAAVYYYGKAEIDNSDGRLRIGMTVQTNITVASAENALLAPLMAVSSGPNGKKSVRILAQNGTVQQRDVTVGINDGVRVQILSGLQAGDKVVTGVLSQEEIKAQGQSRRRGPF
ncbi:MAG: Macrolide export protein MacA [Desulfovibrio sp.]